MASAAATSRSLALISMFAGIAFGDDIAAASQVPMVKPGLSSSLHRHPHALCSMFLSLYVAKRCGSNYNSPSSGRHRKSSPLFHPAKRFRFYNPRGVPSTMKKPVMVTVLCAILSMASGTQAQKIKVIVDQDARGPATTDMQSILIFLQSDKFDVLGITTVTRRSMGQRGNPTHAALGRNSWPHRRARHRGSRISSPEFEGRN